METSTIKKGKSKTTYFSFSMKKGKNKTIQIFPFSTYICQNEKSFYNFGPRKRILAVYKYSRRLLTRALPLKFEVIIFRYTFFMAGYSLPNFNLRESHIAQFHIGFKKCFFLFLKAHSKV